MIEVYQNKDKIYNDQSHEIEPVTSENMISGLVEPFRALIVAKSGSGKTNLVRNILNIKNFDIVYLCHGDCQPETEITDEDGEPLKKVNNNSLDYDDHKVIPIDIKNKDDPENQDMKSRLATYRAYRKVIIFDDYDFYKCTKRDLLKFAEILTYISTHTNTSIIISIQNMVGTLPPFIRQLVSVNILFNNKNTDVLNVMRKRASSILNTDEFNIAIKLLKKPWDFLLLDEQRQAAWIVINNEMILLKA
jgi:hypothetical protein